MKIIFPYKASLQEVDMALVRLDSAMTYHWHLEGMGYPYKYFKRR